MFAALFGEWQSASGAVGHIHQGEGGVIHFAMGEAGCDGKPVIAEAGRKRWFSYRIEQTFDGELTGRAEALSRCANDGDRSGCVAHGRQAVTVAFRIRLAAKATASE